jgi:hypothetical protein
LSFPTEGKKGMASRLLHIAIFKRNPFPPFSVLTNLVDVIWLRLFQETTPDFQDAALDANLGSLLGKLRRSDSFIARGVSPWKEPAMG